MGGFFSLDGGVNHLGGGLSVGGVSPQRGGGSLQKGGVSPTGIVPNRFLPVLGGFFSPLCLFYFPPPHEGKVRVHLLNKMLGLQGQDAGGCSNGPRLC